jgi:hypothetical protein
MNPLTLVLLFRSFALFINPQIAALSSACCFLVAHWSTITMVSDRSMLAFILCISVAFIITTLYLTNANTKTCMGCLVWLYVVVVFANTVGTHESLHVLMDVWAITSAAAIALASSTVRLYLRLVSISSLIFLFQYSETYFQVWRHVCTPSYAAISVVFLFVLTDTCTHMMPPNGVARYILWALWLGYTKTVADITKANPFILVCCLAWLWIISIFILTTESPDFRVFLMSLWAVTVIAAFCFVQPSVSLISRSDYFVAYLLPCSPSTPQSSLAVIT